MSAAIAVSPSTLLVGNSWKLQERGGHRGALAEGVPSDGEGWRCKVADVCVSLAIQQAREGLRRWRSDRRYQLRQGNAMLHCQRARVGRSYAVVHLILRSQDPPRGDSVNNVLMEPEEWRHGHAVYAQETGRL